MIDGALDFHMWSLHCNPNPLPPPFAIKALSGLERPNASEKVTITALAMVRGWPYKWPHGLLRQGMMYYDYNAMRCFNNDATRCKDSDAMRFNDYNAMRCYDCNATRCYDHDATRWCGYTATRFYDIRAGSTRRRTSIFIRSLNQGLIRVNCNLYFYPPGTTNPFGHIVRVCYRDHP